jgi:hypothetical protein
MPQPSVRTAIRVMAGSLLTVGLLAAGACSSDDDTKTSGTTTTAPEEKISSDADVAAGLAKMKVSAAAVAAAGSDAAAAGTANDELEPVWEDIEGTVKKNASETYIAIEDSMALLSQGAEGDQEKAKQGAEDITAAIDDYLATYPGGGE